jgi:hypothetical protein
MARILSILGVAAVVFACASGGGGSAVYRRDVGNASFVDAVDRSSLILTRHHYEVLSLDSIPFLRIETHWRPRPPFDDEVGMGVTQAETRVIVTARVRGETEMGSVYNVQLQVENRVRAGGVPDWNERTNTPMFRTYADEIVQDLRQEFLNIGVRRFGTGI